MDRWPVVWAILLTLSSLGRARAETEPAANHILVRMFKAYASTPSFACEGECEDQQEGSPLPPDHRTVSVRFVRPDKFRLAWTQKDFHGHSGTSVIFTKQGQILFRDHGQSGDAEVEPTLSQAISSCAGISLGLSYLVPALLLGEPGYLNFVSLRQEAGVRSEDGHACWHLSGQTSEGARWDLLIERQTYALREASEINVLAPASAHRGRSIRTRYRFTNVRFGVSRPDSGFGLSTAVSSSPGANQRRGALP